MGAPLHYGIVGGGMLGLMLAHRLRQAGHAVTVLEAAPDLGGLASAWQIGDVTWDRHYHVILMSDLKLRGLLDEIGLADELRWVETKTGFYTDGRLHSMSNSWEFLTFPPLRLIDKFRLGLTILRASRLHDWKKLERIPVVDWLRRWSGRRTLEKIWLPLLRAKLGESYRIASAAFIWAIIARMYAARRSGLKKEMFGYVRGGYARILERFAKHLSDAGVDLRMSQRVSRIDGFLPLPASGRGLGGGVCDGVAVHLDDGESLRFGRVIVTAAAPLASKLVPGLSNREHQLLNGVTYQGIVCASLLLKKPLAQYYVTNITDDAPFTAVIEMSALVDRVEFGGNCLVYLPKYVAPDDPHFHLSDDEIRERFVSALERMYPHFTRADLLAFRISRVRHVFAVSTLGYSERVPPVATSLPGVYLVNSAHIVNGTLNVNETLTLAESVLPTILAATPHAAEVASL
jgi:protoporphyrinogen oxidase